MSAARRFSGQSIETVRRTLAARLRQTGVETPALDARLLLGAALGLDLTGMIAASTRRVTAAEAAQLEGFARRRIAGEPVARIVGNGEFWGLPLRLSADTLAPRPDTETVVEAALGMIGAQAGALRIVDIGVGSGAILLALLHELPEAFGVGVDVSPGALRTAQANAASLGLSRRARFVASDYLAALAGRFDLIVANPPYIRSADIAALATEVRDHDPRRALDGGVDGLNAYRAIARQACARLAPGGALVLEIGQGQGADVERIVAATGLRLEGPPKPDLSGTPRVVSARKSPR